MSSSRWAGMSSGRVPLSGAPPRRRRELTDQQIAEIREAFNIFDTNGRDCIEAREFKMVLKALGFDPSTDEMYSIMATVDKNDTGVVTYEEYFKVVKSKMLERDPMDDILKSFKLFADPNTNTIGLKDLRNIADELGEVVTDEELAEMIREADRDKDGVVNQSEFVKIMRKSNLF